LTRFAAQRATTPPAGLLVALVGVVLSVAAAGASVTNESGPAPRHIVQAVTGAASGEAVQEGKRSFRGRCARCHGIDGQGLQAPDLRISASRLDDAEMFRIVRFGIPGTDMPAGGPTIMPDVEVLKIVAYLRTLAGAEAPGTPGRGNPANGEKIFRERSGCAGCHWVLGRGGRLGPELSRIGSARSRTFIAAKIRDPHGQVTVGFETVTVVTGDGGRVSGVRKNEDTFSIQLFDASERLHFFFKTDVREVITEARSLMPAYGRDRLSDAELEDLVAYLATLRGPAR
jgi:cytochrome c oxidase cbb3-type subunit 3